MLFCSLDCLFCQSDRFHLAEHLLGQFADSDAGAGRLADKVFLIHRVESGKVLHVCQEAGRLDDLRKVRPGSLQNGADVFAALFRLFGNGASDNLACLGVQGYLTLPPSCIQQQIVLPLKLKELKSRNKPLSLFVLT